MDNLPEALNAYSLDINDDVFNPEHKALEELRNKISLNVGDPQYREAVLSDGLQFCLLYIANNIISDVEHGSEDTKKDAEPFRSFAEDFLSNIKTGKTKLTINLKDPKKVAEKVQRVSTLLTETLEEHYANAEANDANS